VNKSYTTAPKIEKAILVGLALNGEPVSKTEEYLEELKFLTTTLGVRILSTFIQKLDHADPRSFVGRGKLEEIKEQVTADNADMVIFDDDLSPSQLRNLEKSDNQLAHITRNYTSDLGLSLGLDDNLSRRT